MKCKLIDRSKFSYTPRLDSSLESNQIHSNNRCQAEYLRFDNIYMTSANTPFVTSVGEMCLISDWVHFNALNGYLEFFINCNVNENYVIKNNTKKKPWLLVRGVWVANGSSWCNE